MSFFVLGKTALRPRPEQDYDCRRLVRELEIGIRVWWQIMQEDRKDRDGRPFAARDRDILLALLEVRRGGRKR